MGKRHRLDIVFEILTRCEEGALKTHIMYETNLSYDQVQRYLEVLQEIKFIKKPVKKRLYFTTGKGFNFLQIYQKTHAVSNKLAEKFDSLVRGENPKND